MTLIVILFCLAIQRFADLGGWFNNSWFEIYLGWFKPLLNKCNKWAGIIIILLPILMVLIILHLLLLWRLFDLFYLIFAIIILLFCMDARDIAKQLCVYFAHAEKQELEPAKISVSEFCNETLPSSNMAELIRKVTAVIFSRTASQMFFVLFWFVVFGIYGAAGYYLITLLRKFATDVDGSFVDLQEAAGVIQDILDWIPSRLLGLSYALAGDFMHGFSYCFKNCGNGIENNQKFVVESGLMSLGLNLEDVTAVSLQENKAALALIDRALIIWVLVISLVIFARLL